MISPFILFYFIFFCSALYLISLHLSYFNLNLIYLFANLSLLTIETFYCFEYLHFCISLYFLSIFYIDLSLFTLFTLSTFSNNFALKFIGLVFNFFFQISPIFLFNFLFYIFKRFFYHKILK